MRVRRQISLALLCAATSLLGCEDAPPADVDPCADPAALPYIEGAHVSAQAAVAEMAGACSSSQSIFVHGEDLTELRLPHMQWVAKDIEVGWCRPRDRGCVGNPRLSVVEAPRLKRIRSLTIGKPGAPNPALTTVSFPQLEEISEHLVIQAEALEGIEFPALKRVGGRIEIARCVSEGPSCVAMNRLRFIHMPKLEQSSDILIGGEDRSLTSLTSLRMESLAKVRGDLRFRGMPALMALGLPALRRVDGHLELNHVPRLIALSLPTLASVRGQLLLHELHPGLDLKQIPF